MKIKYTLGLICLALGMSQCGGASTTDGTASNLDRTISGNVSDSTPAALMKETRLDINEDGCFADSVIATDTSGNTTVAEVDANCDFSLILETDKSYSISLTLNDEFVASLIFDDSRGYRRNRLPLTGEGDIDMGTITLEGSLAWPNYNPLRDCDYDDDGESDYDDEDDDNDGYDDSSDDSLDEMDDSGSDSSSDSDDSDDDGDDDSFDDDDNDNSGRH